MRIYSVVGIAAGSLCVFLGILFSLFISLSPANLASDLIFLGAGFLLIRKGLKERKVLPKPAKQDQNPKNPKQKGNPRKKQQPPQKRRQ
ncbi:MAG: hypothetical protein ACYC7D_06145 [Nitrososphaerales archaeon]